MILRSIVIQYLFSHYDFPMRNEEQKGSLWWPKAWWSGVGGGSSMVDEHSQMGNTFRHDCPRSKGSSALLKVEDVLTVFITVDYFGLSNQSARVHGQNLVVFDVPRGNHTSAFSSNCFNTTWKYAAFNKTLQNGNIFFIQVANLWFFIRDAIRPTPQSNFSHHFHIVLQVLLLVLQFH